MGMQAFLTWKSKDTDQRIFWPYGPPPAEWVPQQEVRYFATSSVPSLVTTPPEAGGNVYMAWKGADDDTRIWLTIFSTGWSDQWSLGDYFRTVDRPALACNRNQLLIAWRGSDTDQHLWYATCNLPGGWSQPGWAVNGMASSTHGPADGIVGPITWYALIATRQSGDSGDSVSVIQSQLISKGFSLTVSGTFDSDTVTAVQNFPSSQGLAVDGIIVPMTWMTLVQ